MSNSKAKLRQSRQKLLVISHTRLFTHIFKIPNVVAQRDQKAPETTHGLEAVAETPHNLDGRLMLGEDEGAQESTNSTLGQRASGNLRKPRQSDSSDGSGFSTENETPSMTAYVDLRPTDPSIVHGVDRVSDGSTEHYF